MSVGSFVFMLHSHLPYYRKAGMWPFGEESLYECMAETYIPLLDAIDELWQEGIPAKLTIGITPILAEQLADEHLIKGFETYVNGRITQSTIDEKRFSVMGEEPHPKLHHLAKFYLNWWTKIKDNFENKWQKNILAGFKKFQDLNAIEITTSAATHCFSPLIGRDESLKAQYQTGVEAYKEHFGTSPKGAWLPECAYRPAQNGRPSIDKWLHEFGLNYFFTESTVIKGGQSAQMRRVFGPYGTIEYLPVTNQKATGHDTYEAYWLNDYPVAVMGRNEVCGYQVWSADHGYPGDGEYREFHKKDDKSGLHYWKLTSTKTDLGDKEYYNPESALSRLSENSDHYVGLIQQTLTDFYKTNSKPGLIMVSFDTELFGHWWFEGISFIKDVIRKLKAYTAVNVYTASEYLKLHPPTQAITLPESSWGAGGHYQVWSNNDTQWMWPIIHDCEDKMQELSQQQNSKTDPLSKRAFKQLLRELLLIQSSDWPFLVTTGQAKQYAIERFNDHCDRFNKIAKMITDNNINEEKLFQIENIDNCFPHIKAEYFSLA